MGAWRTGIASVVLFGLLWFRGAPIRPSAEALTGVVAAGLAFGIDLSVWHRSIEYAGTGMATILGNTQVFWSALVGVLFLKESLSPRFIGATVAAFVGVVLLAGLGSQVEFTPRYLLGIAFGLCTGVAYACYLLGLRKAERAKTNDTSALTASIRNLAWGCLFACVVLGGVAVAAGEPLVPTTVKAGVGVTILAIVPQVLGWLLIAGGLGRLTAARAGLLLLLQPALAALWGSLVFGEALQVLQVAGAALVLGAVYVGAQSRKIS